MVSTDCNIDNLNPKRIFSYCLYGTKIKYCLGMVKNLDQIKKLFPNYETWITIGNDVPQSYIDIYSSYKNVKLIHTNLNSGRLMSYRLFPLDNPLVEIMFTRDADSRFSERDIWCMNEFMQSKYRIFTIRDHWFQRFPIMMGQSGFRNLGKIDIESLYKTFTNNRGGGDIDRYNSDQYFADEYLYNRYINDILVFSEFVKFPNENIREIKLIRKDNKDFCGNVSLFNEDMSEYWEYTMAGHANKINLRALPWASKNFKL
jgi:hypothetical protein